MLVGLGAVFEESDCKLISTYIGPIRVTNEVWTHEIYTYMIISHNSSVLSDGFRDGIRARMGNALLLVWRKNQWFYMVLDLVLKQHTPLLW